MAELKVSSSLKAALDWDSSDLKDQLFKGILLNNGTKKFSLDAGTSVYTITFYARALYIEWGNDPRFWMWKAIRESGSLQEIEVAQVLGVTWLYIIARPIRPSILLPRVLYVVGFEMLMKSEAIGFETPVNRQLKMPNQSPIESSINLAMMPREQWIEIPVGSFVLDERDICDSGDIEFSLFETRGGNKAGLVVRSAFVRPWLF